MGLSFRRASRPRDRGPHVKRPMVRVPSAMNSSGRRLRTLGAVSGDSTMRYAVRESHDAASAQLSSARWRLWKLTAGRSCLAWMGFTSESTYDSGARRRQPPNVGRCRLPHSSAVENCLLCEPGKRLHERREKETVFAEALANVTNHRVSELLGGARVGRLAAGRKNQFVIWE